MAEVIREYLKNIQSEVKMDAKRKGEIALALLKYRLQKESVSISPNLRRELGNVAKETGIPLEEVILFVKSLYEEILERAFAPSVRVL